MFVHHLPARHVQRRAAQGGGGGRDAHEVPLGEGLVVGRGWEGLGGAGGVERDVEGCKV